MEQRTGVSLDISSVAIFAANEAFNLIIASGDYPDITKAVREKHDIRKTHTSDARCIARAPLAAAMDKHYLIKPVRRHNRQMHKAKIYAGGYRKNNQAPKYVFGFRLFDMVDVCGEETGFVFGRRSSGSFDIRHLDGRKISAGINYKKLQLLAHPGSLLIEQHI